MTAEKPSRMVPKLRFQEFRDAGEWELDEIGGIASISKGKGVSKANIAESGLTPCIRYAELYTHYGEVIREVLSLTNVLPEDLVLSQAGDVIVPASGETKEEIARAACVVSSGVALGGDLNIIRSDLNGLFFSYLLNSPIRHTIARLAQGDTVAHLYPGQISQVKITYPQFAEQHKIADCLTSLDDLISAQNQKLEALRQHKKGLLQKLFPRPGESVPQLRFQEFRDAGEWEEQSLCNVSRILQGGTPDTSKTNYWDGSIAWLTPAEMGKHDSPYIGTTTRTITNAGLQNCSSALLPVHSIILSTRAPIGHLAINTSPMAINQGCKGLCPKADLHYMFLHYSLLHAMRRLVDLGAGNTFKELSGASLNKFVIPLPSPAEQQKIAYCLASLDDLISAHSQKLEAQRQHKQGLFQQLFPSPVRASGKARREQSSCPEIPKHRHRTSPLQPHAVAIDSVTETSDAL